MSVLLSSRFRVKFSHICDWSHCANWLSASGKQSTSTIYKHTGCRHSIEFLYPSAECLVVTGLSELVKEIHNFFLKFSVCSHCNLIALLSRLSV